MKTKKNLSLFAVSCFSLLTFSFSGTAMGQSLLEGAWVLEQTASADGSVDTEPLPGFWLFTKNHYSVMVVTGDKPRALLDEQNPSDAQVLEAYGSFTANSGRYEVDGDQFIIHPYVAKVPNFMAAFPETTLSFSFVRDGDTLLITGPDGGTGTYLNVDDSPPPWE